MTLVINYAPDVHTLVFVITFCYYFRFVLIIFILSIAQAWDEGLLGAKKGSRRLIICPSSHAHGAEGRGSIPANSAVVYDIEVIRVRTQIQDILQNQFAFHKTFIIIVLSWST